MKLARYVLGAIVRLMRERETLLLTVRNEFISLGPASPFQTPVRPTSRKSSVIRTSSLLSLVSSVCGREATAGVGGS